MLTFSCQLICLKGTSTAIQGFVGFIYRKPFPFYFYFILLFMNDDCLALVGESESESLAFQNVIDVVHYEAPKK